MAKHKINPETLKDFRTRAGLSQQGLAEFSRVSKKTIARIESGTSSVNTNTLTRLAKALNIKPEKLSNPSGFEENLLFGYRTEKLTLPENLLLALDMVERCYGISPDRQLRLAPLFTALMIEGSLAWRKRKLDATEDAFEKLSENFKDRNPNFEEGKMHIENVLRREEDSIKQRDFFGKTINLDDLGWDEFMLNEWDWPHYSINTSDKKNHCDPFQQYLKYLAGKLDEDIIQIHEGDSENLFAIFGLEWIDYTINSSELEDITGGDFLAQKSLQWGCTTLKDIPENLLEKEASAERISWLRNQIPQEKREGFVKSLGIMLADLQNNQQHSEGTK